MRELCITEATEVCSHDIQTEAVTNFSLCAERLEAEKTKEELKDIQNYVDNGCLSAVSVLVHNQGLMRLDLQGIHRGGETSKETVHLGSSQDGPDIAWQSGLRDNEEGSLFKIDEAVSLIIKFSHNCFPCIFTLGLRFNIFQDHQLYRSMLLIVNLQCNDMDSSTDTEMDHVTLYHWVLLMKNKNLSSGKTKERLSHSTKEIAYGSVVGEPIQQTYGKIYRIILL
ncbi:hypothetical protein MG293_020352 [Ovis ammon polii]|uniref:Uncharacterized protein n=1 Tax=Ovis ammon polii TaxID=230172 RepID=A0AAD4XZP3_OVIAM|nr:hypothetical protein MG293_020352 [Ovis ammon polii]